MRGEEPEATEESVLAKHVDAGYQVCGSVGPRVCCFYCREVGAVCMYTYMEDVDWTVHAPIHLRGWLTDPSERLDVLSPPIHRASSRC